MKFFNKLSIVLWWLAHTNAKLIVNEYFESWEYWKRSLHGDTAIANLVPSILNESQNMLFTNLSYCGLYECYRAEIAQKQATRSKWLNSTGTYWFGMRNYIPPNWVWLGQTDPDYDEVIYHFQVHTGDNGGESPLFGIRNLGYKMELNVCGDLFDNTTICNYYYYGTPAPGVWTDWVIRVDFVFGTQSGNIKAWRNNILMIAEENIVTSYDQKDNPYMKMGTYDIPWKTGHSTLTQWGSCYYTNVRLGDENSSYEEVYTGDGSMCGVYCLPEATDDDSGNSVEDSELLSIILLSTLPVSVIILGVLLFYCANWNAEAKRQQDIDAINKATALRKNKMQNRNSEVTVKKKPQDLSEKLINGTLSTEGSGKRGRGGSVSGRQSTSGRHSVTSGGRESLVDYARTSINAALRNTFVWEEEEDYVLMSRFEWTDPWQASLTRKVFWYIFGYGSVSVFLALAFVLYGNPITNEDGLIPYKRLRDWTLVDVFAFFAVTFVTTGIYFIPLALMPHRLSEGKVWQNDPDFLKRIGVIIPCHKSALEIGKVLTQVLKYIPPENVVVCDNGNFAWPADNTFTVVKECHPKINYLFIAQGHKTRALWTGVHRLPPNCKYVMHLDDDTLLSDHMVFDEAHFMTEGGNHVSAVGFLRSSFRINRVTNFTDFWYKITDHFHATQARICTRAFVPGPAGLWRRDRFVEIFGAHPALPFGEDIFGGFTTLNKGYAIRAENRCMVTTFAPPILVNCGGIGRVQGYGASSLWKQRAHRWTVSALRITGKSLYSFFTYDCKMGILPNIAFRLYRFREYKILFVQVMYIPFIIILLARGFYVEFILVKIMLFVLPLMRNIYINYICWRNNPELQCDLETLLLSPLFNFFLIMCAVHGRLKCLLWYLPEVPPNHGMLQRVVPDKLDLVKERAESIYSENMSRRNSENSSRQDSVDVSLFRNVATMKMMDGQHPEYLNKSIDPELPDAFEFFNRDGTSTFMSFSDGGDEIDYP